MRMQDIAEMAGVSRFTVSAVLYGKKGVGVSEKTRKKVLELVKKHNFIPNQMSRQLRGGTTNLVGFLTAASQTGLSAAINSSLTLELQRRGLVLLSSVCANHSDVEHQLANFLSYRVKCVIVKYSENRLEKVVKDQIPLVYCTHDNAKGFDVGTDNESGSQEAASFLLNQGRKKIAYISFNEIHRFDERKITGIKAAFTENGLSARSLKVVNYYPEKENLQTLVKKISKFDALMCCNDHLAGPLLIEMRKSGIKIPDDIAIIGFDGYTFCDLLPIPLATIVQPVKQLAQKTADFSIKWSERKERPKRLANITVPPIFRPAESCGANSGKGYAKTTESPLLDPPEIH